MAGQEVSVVARGESLAAIRSDGLVLVEPDGSVDVARDVAAADEMAALGRQDVVVLAVKAHQIAELAPSLEDLYDDATVVLPLQNGLPWWFFHKWPGPY